MFSSFFFVFFVYYFRFVFNETFFFSFLTAFQGNTTLQKKISRFHFYHAPPYKKNHPILLLVIPNRTSPTKKKFRFYFYCEPEPAYKKKVIPTFTLIWHTTLQKKNSRF